MRWEFCELLIGSKGTVQPISTGVVVYLLCDATKPVILFKTIVVWNGYVAINGQGKRQPLATGSNETNAFFSPSPRYSWEKGVEWHGLQEES